MLTNNLTYKDIVDYENLMIRFYHSFLSTNYLAELLCVALRHLPEDVDAEVLFQFAEEYEEISPLAVSAAQAFTDVYFSMVEASQPPSPAMIAMISSYESVKKEMQANIARVWLDMSMVFSEKEMDEITAEVDASIALQDIQQQYDEMLVNQYPTLPDNVKSVVEQFKAMALQQNSEENQQGVE